MSEMHEAVKSFMSVTISHIRKTADILDKLRVTLYTDGDEVRGNDRSREADERNHELHKLSRIKIY